jgi:hypothetical protein
MEAVAFTVTAIVLYAVSETLLDRLERRLRHRLPYRSLIFFGILSVLALGSFAVLDRIS